MAFDYKKEYKDLYLPKKTPGMIAVPPMSYAAVKGNGDPNAPDSEYKQSIGILYAILFTIKMSKKGEHRIDGYFDFVVPPLEGFWRTEEGAEIDFSDKSNFCFISAIRLPDFVTPEIFAWAADEASKKKKTDLSKAYFLPYDEGVCVQCMHIGAYDDEPATIERMHEYAGTQGYAVDLNGGRSHHEIYLSDPRRTAPDRLRTVIRLPVVKETMAPDFI